MVTEEVLVVIAEDLGVFFWVVLVIIEEVVVVIEEVLRLGLGSTCGH